MNRAAVVVLAGAVVAMGVSACYNGTAPPEPRPATLSLEVAAAPGPEIPLIGTDSTFDAGTWNLEWFGDPSNGPSPEERQLENVATLMDAAGVDLWAVQEVTGGDQFDALVDRLVHYDGLLATDPVVMDGEAYYSGFDGNEMKVGLVYRSGEIRVDSARVILTDHDFDFAGRPPVKVHLTVGDDPSTALAVIVLHAKAGADPEDRDRRADGAAALMAYLDARYPDAPVLVIGDFNDDVDTSIADGYPSPYADFVDAAGYAFPTAALSAAGETSMVYYPDVIDHQMATDELMAHYVDGTAAVVPADRWLEAYPESTSDHYPVVARYILPGGAIASGPVLRVALRWSGASSTAVDIYRDGALRVRTENDGEHVDTVAVEAESVTYRVCEAATAVCSGEAVYRP